MRYVLGFTLAYLLLVAIFCGVCALLARPMWANASAIVGIRWAVYVTLSAFAFAGIYVQKEVIDKRLATISAGRQIASDTAAKIVGYLQPLSLHRPMLVVNFQPTDDEEARAYASQLVRLLRKAGWQTMEATGTEGESPFDGVRMIVYAGPRDPEKKASWDAMKKAVIATLHALEQPIQIFPNQSLEDTTVGSIVVGPRSKKYPTPRTVQHFDSEDDRFDLNALARPDSNAL